MADDTPELGRLVVLHGSLLAHLFDELKVDRTDAGLIAILKEADALTFRVAHRSRSAAGYTDTPRGQAALDDLEQVREIVLPELPAGERVFPSPVEISEWVWTREQLSGPIMPGMKPERLLKRTVWVTGMRLLTPDDQPLGDNRADNP